MAKWDAIVVGAGTSGLGTGALLANAGLKVLMLEKQKFIGGRASSATYKGRVLEHHSPARFGYFEEVFSRIGKPCFELLDWYDGLEAYVDGEWVFLMEHIPQAEFRKMINEIAQMSYEEAEKFDDVSLKTWVSQRTDNKYIHYLFWQLGMGVCVGNAFEPISAGQFFWFIKRQLDKWGNLSNVLAIVRGGLENLYEPLAGTVREKGGEIRTGVRVTNVVIEEGKVRGVEIEKGEKIIPKHLPDTELIEAPIVVNTLPLWDLFTIVSEDEFPEWYTMWVESVQQKMCYIWDIIYACDQPLWNKSTVRWAPELTHCSGLSLLCCQLPDTYDSFSEEKFTAHFLIQCHWNEFPSIFQIHKARVRNQIREKLDLCEQDIKELFPGIEERYEWKMYTGSPFGVAPVPGLVGRYLPSIKPPGVDNLYLVSDTIREGSAVGIEGTGKAALECADLILSRY